MSRHSLPNEYELRPDLVTQTFPAVAVSDPPRDVCHLEPGLVPVMLWDGFGWADRYMQIGAEPGWLGLLAPGCPAIWLTTDHVDVFINRVWRAVHTSRKSLTGH